MLRYELLLLSVCFYYAEQKQKDFEGHAFDEVSLDSHYQSELVALWEANTAAESCYYSSPWCCFFRDGSVGLFYSVPKVRFAWGGLALSLSFCIPVFLVKNIAGSRCS